ncbi:unnamed protein product [Sphagnum balticum]
MVGLGAGRQYNMLIVYNFFVDPRVGVIEFQQSLLHTRQQVLDPLKLRSHGIHEALLAQSAGDSQEEHKFVGEGPAHGLGGALEGQFEEFVRTGASFFAKEEKVAAGEFEGIFGLVGFEFHCEDDSE